LAAEGMKPLDVALQVMRLRFAADPNDPEAAKIAMQIAPYFHQRFAPTDQPAVAHKEQQMLPLFDRLDELRAPALGKKDRARLDAEKAGEGTDWGDDLIPKPN
jgi:hypothetical protein